VKHVYIIEKYLMVMCNNKIVLVNEHITSSSSFIGVTTHYGF